METDRRCPGCKGPQPGRAVLRLVIAAGMLLTAGCAASYQGVKDERGFGTSRSFPGSAENAWHACILGLHELGLDLKELDPDRRYLLASQGTSMLSYGEHVGCFVRSDTVPGRQSVEIVTQRVVATNVFAKDWSEEALWTIGIHMSRLDEAESGPWLQASHVDACVDEALEVGRRSNLEISHEEKQRCRKDAKGSSETEAACLVERERVRAGWIVHADPETVEACLDGSLQESMADRT